MTCRFAFVAVALVSAGCADGGASGGPGPILRDDGARVIDGGRPDAGEAAECEVDLDCNDGVFCTWDRCAGGECRHEADDLQCDPGLSCDPVDDCRSGPPCVDDGECDDGLYCNGFERCDPTLMGGTCVAGAPPECDDGVACTEDGCDEMFDTCTYLPNDAACADGSFCNGDEVCDAVDGCLPAAAPVDCDDGIACTRDRCDAAAGRCLHEAMDDVCDDGAACNGDERCDVAAGCVPGAPVDCDDGVSCTTDSCVEPGVCRHGTSDADGDGVIALGCADGTDCDDTSSAVHPGATEVCDGLDNDCSGDADDAPGMECVLGSAPRACTTACGTAGTRSCNVACRLSPCFAATETCNDCDDDGDGAIDDGLACRRGTTVACTTACGTAGVRTCAGDCSGYGPCVAMEICNGCDDDGDGRRDDGVGACPSGATETCVTASGVAGMRTCSADCSAWGACTAAEVCNGLDDDGDGDADEDFPCVRGVSEACTTACGMASTRTCSATCTMPSCAVAAEVCGNGCDDDGDGVVDGGCNDLCESAVPIMPLAAGTTTGSTGGAGREVTDCGPVSGTPGAEVWYSITVGSRSLVYFDTFGSPRDTTLSLHASCGAPSLLCEDDDCGTLQDVLVAVVDPGTHYLAVQARRTADQGPFRLRWQSFAVPANGSPTRVTGNGTVTGRTAGTASTYASCEGTGVESFHYFTVCPDTTKTVTASTCGSASSFDSVVSILAGGEMRACVDDESGCGTRSTATADVTGPGAGLVVVDSFRCCETASYSLEVSGL